MTGTLADPCPACGRKVAAFVGYAEDPQPGTDPVLGTVSLAEAASGWPHYCTPAQADLALRAWVAAHPVPRTPVVARDIRLTAPEQWTASLRTPSGLRTVGVYPTRVQADRALGVVEAAWHDQPDVDRSAGALP